MTLSAKTIRGGLILWIVLVLLGTSLMWRHTNTAGATAIAAPVWPLDELLKLDPQRPTLIMTVHPRCPCSRASYRELERLMSRCGDKLKAYVVLSTVRGLPTDNETTAGIVSRLQQIPNVTVIDDPGMKVTDRLGAQTSGHAFLYSQNGQLQFSGGITAGRGHEGENAGTDAIEALVNQHAASTSTSNVFGCSIR